MQIQLRIYSRIKMFILFAGRNIRALIRPFPKYTPNKPIDEMPRAEIILYEQSATPDTGPENMQLVVRCVSLSFVRFA